MNKVLIQASQQERYDFVIQIAMGTLEYEGIVSWIKKYTRPQ
jgi:death on curing protein